MTTTATLFPDRTRSRLADHRLQRASLRVRISVFTSLRGYERSWLRFDLVAALTVWAVLHGATATESGAGRIGIVGFRP